VHWFRRDVLVATCSASMFLVEYMLTVIELEV
jgi:hypothetical protein